MSFNKENSKSKSDKVSKNKLGRTQADKKTTDIITLPPNGVNDLMTDEIFRLADLYFNKKNYIFRHLYDSYNKFLEEDVKNFFENGEHVFTETITPTTYYKYRFKFENVMMDEPTLNNGVEPMFPSDARHENLTYSVKLVADVTQYQDIIDIASDQKITKQIENTEKGKHIATIPLMVRSKWCSLYTNKGVDKNECDFDAGGYFIVNGNEKVVICQDRMVENKPLVFIKKDSGSMSYIVQITSKSYKPHGMTQVLSVKMKKDGVMMLRVPILNEVNVCAVFRALGLESDRDIIDYIAYDEHDADMVDLIRLTLDNCKTDKGAKISSQEEAIDYLIPKLRMLKRYTESDNTTKMLQKQMHLKNLLQNNFLPHVEGPLIKKAYYLGYMLNRLLRVYLGRQPLDDRDSYLNKRIDLPGDLMFELFKLHYKKLLGECKKFFDVRNKSIETPINVIANIKPNIIEQGFKASLSTGHWIRRQGVAQMLQRLTYLITISFLRRVDAPGGDASSAKLTNPRHVHPSSVPMLCCLTGDSEILMGDGRVELIKNLSNGDIINSVYKDTLKEVQTSIINYFSINSEKLFEIITISGRKLKCTPDHPILIRTSEGENIMKYTENLQEGDKVIIRHFHKYIPVDKECEIIITEADIKNKMGVVDFSKKGLLNKPIPQKLLEITARLIGMLSFDNKLGNDNILIPHDGSNINTNMLRTYINNVSDFNFLNLSNEELSCYFKLMGAQVDCQMKIPDWIVNGNLPIKREFLSGLNNISNSSNIYWKNNLIEIKPFDVAIINKNIIDSNIVIDYMNSIVLMYNELGINSYVTNKNDVISCNFSNTLENIEKFVDTIIFTNTNTKINTSIIEYVKYKNFNRDQSENTIDFEEFFQKYYLADNNLAVPIKSIKVIPNEIVYDYETKCNTHTIMSNSVITSNCTQTPEHAKVGLTKHLSLISSITIMSRDQYSLIMDYVTKKVINITDVPHHKLRNYNMYRVFLNGDWIGMTEEPQNLINEMNAKKIDGYFDQKNVSIVPDNDECEIKIYCDSGRLYRPTIRVHNNELLLKRHHIEKISLNKSQRASKITDWEEFLIKNPGVIDYVDSELQPYLLIADKSKVVEEMRQRMTKSIDLVKNVKSRHVDNRYDEMFYLKYTNCEIHPALLMGEITTNVPFTCRNDGPRNIFFYAQSRQAMGIFATNYRDRLDISFILYYPQRPLVSTRSAKYTNSEHLPAGENCMVAIACYTGYNQEDSLIFNRSSIERGKFRAMYLKKYLLQIQKNQSTSQDDQFMKPDPNKVIGMKHGSYDKLNDRGFVPEETQLFSGDVIFGKVTPIEDPNNTGKCFKDSSESYKMFPPGVVDRLYIDIQNQDGYMTRKASIRSERIPRIGDKYCFPESANVEVLTDKGWINIKDVTKTHKVASLINNEHIEYVIPTGIYKFNHDGNMYRLRSQQVDIDCTLNHKLYAKRRDKENYELIEAEKLIGKRFNLKKNCKNLNPDVKTFDLIEGKKIDMNTWLKFFGIWLLNSLPCKNKINLLFSNVGDTLRAKKIISKLGYSCVPNYDNKIIQIHDDNLYSYLNSPNDKILEWIYNLSKSQSMLLLDSITKLQRFVTISNDIANLIARLAIHCEFGANITLIGKKYCVDIIKSTNEPQINCSNNESQNESIYHYKGNIYCLEVPSHVMMIRQNGKNVWCGNSSRHGKVLPKSLKIKVRHSVKISLLI